MKENLQPHLLCGKDDLAPYVLLPGDPGRVERIGSKLSSYEVKAYNREYKTITGKLGNIPVSVVSSGIGGPSAAIAMEELSRLGVRAVIRVGSCGGWLPEIRIGDLVIPQGVVRNEGTSTSYAPECWPAVPDFDLYRVLTKAAEELDYRAHAGITICRDNFYVFSESIDSYVDRWKKYRIIASEMEAATVLTVGRLRGLQAAAIFAVVNKTSLTDQEKDLGVREYAIQASTGAKGEAISAEEKAINTALKAVTLLGTAR
jgi:uridine phosphorylase